MSEEQNLFRPFEVRRGGPDGPLVRTGLMAVPAVPAFDDDGAECLGVEVPLVRRLGDVAGHPACPQLRWARVVGVLKNVAVGGHWLVLREYANETERWPSGRYVTAWFAVPWQPHQGVTQPWDWQR